MRPRTRECAAIALASVFLTVQPARAGQEGGQDPAAGARDEPSPGTPAPRPRSVLFYLLDTCRYDRLSFDGYGRGTTPFLEWLAARSVVFEACYGQAAWTKPSMASMLTSQYPSTTGVYKMDHRLPDELVTWPEALHANGMYTAGFSANIVMGNTLSNFAQGFDHFVESTEVNGGDPIRFASGSARKLNDRAFAWLDSTDHWPMLLYLHSVDPHEEYEPEPSYLERFADPGRHARYREEWKELLASRPPIPGLYVTQENFDRTGIDSSSFIEHGSNLYDADILANDDQIRRLWDELKKDGWGDDLVFVFTSDHGEEFFEHGGTSHGYSLYEEMVHVPLMIYAPGLLPAGKRIDTPVRSLDVYPTLCDLLGFEVPEGLEGRSLVPLIQARGPATAGGHPAIYSEHREDPLARRIGQGSGVLVSLRSGRWKLVVNQTSSQLLEKPRFELFDVVEDPGERADVADRYPDVVKRLELDAATFIARQWGADSVADSSTMDPEVLEQLRALGYVGEEEDAPDIWAAMESGDAERVRRSLASGAAPGRMDEVFGLRPLSMAALTGDVGLAKILLEGGAEIDARNRDGSTALSGAAFFGRVDVLELLLDEGADPGLENTTGDTALSVTRAPWDVTEYIAGVLRIPLEREAVEEGRVHCAELLALAEREVDPATSRLFAAIAAGDSSGVERSLAEGARLRARDPEKGRTPLYAAAFHGRRDIARLLLEKGAPVDARNDDEASALHGAALMGQVPLIELLIGHGAVVDARDGRGSTPLHAAAFLGRVEAAERLLRASADRSAKDEDGRTALDVTRTSWEITRAVLERLGLDLERAEVEENRASVAKLLRG